MRKASPLGTLDAGFAGFAASSHSRSSSDSLNTGGPATRPFSRAAQFWLVGHAVLNRFPRPKNHSDEQKLTRMVKGGWLVGLVMVVAAVAMTRGERVVECEEEEVHEMQDNFVNCTQHFKQEYNIQVWKEPQVVELPVFAATPPRLMMITLMEKPNKGGENCFYSCNW